MSKTVKALITKDLRERYAGVDGACVVELTGLNVQQQEKLRIALREKSARMQVVKNSLARCAFEDTPLAPLAEAMEGPCALVVSSESLIDAAKTLVNAAKEFNKLKLKHAVFEGDPSLLSVDALSKMKGRQEMLGEVAMLIASPGRSIAACAQSPQSKIAGCLKAIVDKAA